MSIKNNTPRLLKCPVCEENFLTVKNAQKYCSKKCKQRAKYESNKKARLQNMVPNWCKVCGKPFTKERKSDFCSDHCEKLDEIRRKHALHRKKDGLTMEQALKLCKKYKCTYGQLMVKIYKKEIVL